MQREIKFRVWNKVWKCMYYLTGLSFIGKKHIQLYYTDSDDDRTTCTVLLENIELMQYTGLHDKNGIGIYEGDIVRFKEIIYEDCRKKKIVRKETEVMAVSYEHGTFGLKKSINSSRFKAFIWVGEDDELEVIGNIHESPELLEVSE